MKHRHLGANKSLIDRRVLFRAYRRLFGAEDMHSHYRWAAVAPLVDLNAQRTLEVGGGDGRMSFELADLGYAGHITVSEFDARSVAEAKAIAAAGGYGNVTVSRDDVRSLGADQAAFDQALAIDVLEHIDDDEKALAEIAAALKPDGRLVISVPTPRYPHVFGRRFHEHLGHVRDGYWLEDLRGKLERAGFSVEEHRYYTGPAVSRACSAFYRSGIPYLIGVLWAPLVRPFLLRRDRVVGEREGASLVLRARRVCPA